MKWLVLVLALPLLLLASGLLLTEPDLRAKLVGGYGREIMEIHLWSGWVFLGAPLLALALAPHPLLRVRWLNRSRSRRRQWQRGRPPQRPPGT